jgi:hypothetical protein
MLHKNGTTGYYSNKSALVFIDTTKAYDRVSQGFCVQEIEQRTQGCFCHRTMDPFMNERHNTLC